MAGIRSVHTKRDSQPVDFGVLETMSNTIQALRSTGNGNAAAAATVWFTDRELRTFVMDVVEGPPAAQQLRAVAKPRRVRRLKKSRGFWRKTTSRTRCNGRCRGLKRIATSSRTGIVPGCQDTVSDPPFAVGGVFVLVP
jgi:hypothetical protein